MAIELHVRHDTLDSLLHPIDPLRDALYLDVDGTLIDIAETPANVFVPQSLIVLLKDLQALFGGALAIITGRRINEIDRLFTPLRLSASGVHGCEIRSSPDHVIVQQTVTVSPTAVAAISLIAASYPGVMIEPKGTGVAVHYRNVPHNGAGLLRDLQSYFAEQNEQLVVAHGRMVFEILPKGFSKATAIEILSRRDPFLGRRPVMIGDDIGDVPAFDYVLNTGGIYFRVAGEHFSLNNAELVCPTAVRAFLEKLVAGTPIPTRQTNSISTGG